MKIRLDSFNVGFYSGICILIGVVLINSYNFFNFPDLVILGILMFLLALFLALIAIYSVLDT